MPSRTSPSASSSQTLVPPTSPKPNNSTTPSILVLSSLTALLTQLASPEGAPHTAILAQPSGVIIASHSVPTVDPWPAASLSGADAGERVRTYAAVGSSSWEDKGQTQGEGELVLETWLGRMLVAQVGPLLLILVGHEVAPWTVLHKKLTAALDVLKEPLSRVSL